MPEPFTIISLLAAGKAAITGWLANKGADFVKDKVTGFAKDKTNEYGKSLLAQFRENAKLQLRQADKSVPKALRLAYLQALKWKVTVVNGASDNRRWNRRWIGRKPSLNIRALSSWVIRALVNRGCCGTKRGVWPGSR